MTEPSDDPRLEAILEELPAAIWFAFGLDLGKYIAQVKAFDAKRSHKTTTFVIVSSVADAVRAANEWGVDVIVAQGILHSIIIPFANCDLTCQFRKRGWWSRKFYFPSSVRPHPSCTCRSPQRSPGRRCGWCCYRFSSSCTFGHGSIRCCSWHSFPLHKRVPLHGSDQVCSR